MPLVEAFSFTLNTDADTFCTWLEDRSGTWKWDLSFTADKGRAVDIQTPTRRNVDRRTIYSFDAVIEILEEDSGSTKWSSKGWEDAEKQAFRDEEKREGVLCTGVISLVIAPAPRPSQIDVRAICMDERAVDGFSYVLKQIAKAYPEALAPIKRQSEEQSLGDDTTTKPTVEMPMGKRGRASNAEYDTAYENIKSGMSLQDVYEVFKKDEPYPDKAMRDNFRRAMNRRAKKYNDNKGT